MIAKRFGSKSANKINSDVKRIRKKGQNYLSNKRAGNTLGHNLK